MTTSQSTQQATVVLVHGAFADASGWNGVTTRLQAEGHRVVAAANPLRGLASDAAGVRALLDSIDGPVVLVGHSYGGSVIGNAATGTTADVRALVFVAGFSLDAGETTLELSGKFPGSTLGGTLNPVPLADGDTDLYIRPELFREQFAADVPEAEAGFMAVNQRPITDSALNEASGEPAWRTIPSYHLVPSQDLNIPPAALEYMAERAGGPVVTVEGGSHAAFVAQPDVAADLILRAVAERV